MNAGTVVAGTGARRFDIPLGTPMGGYAARNAPSQGEHDPLHARALALRAGSGTIVVVSCDLVGLERNAVARVKARVTAKHGIPAANVMLCATHTHSGPRNIAIFGEPFDGHESIYDTIETAIDDAIGNLQPAGIAAGSARVDDVGFNRRVYDPTSAPVDDTCTVLVVRDEHGAVQCVAYNFACHPVVMGPENLLISADWVHYANETIAAAFPRANTIFLQGACGNVNPVNTPIVGTVPKHTFGEDCAGIGNAVGKAVVGIARNAGPVKLGTPAGKEVPVDIPADDGDKEELFTFASGTMEGDTFTVHTIVQAVAAGDIAIAGVPGELFSEISLRLKARSPFPLTLVAGYANDYIGYIPTRENYRAGGYETSMMSLQEEEGRIIEDAALDALRSVH